MPHGRDELAGILEAMQEAAQAAGSARVPLIFSHHKCAGPANWGRVRETLALIDRIAGDQPVGLDVYPYTAGSTVLREPGGRRDRHPDHPLAAASGIRRLVACRHRPPLGRQRGRGVSPSATGERVTFR